MLFFEIYQILQHGLNEISSNLIVFFFQKRDKRFYVTQLLTAILQYTSVKWSNLFDISMNQPLFLYFYRCVITLTRTRTWFITWRNMWLARLHISTSGINLRNSVVFNVNFSGICLLFIVLLSYGSRHSSLLFHLLSLTLTRSNSQHCSAVFVWTISPSL